MRKLIYIAGRFRAKTPYEIHLNVIHAEAASLRLAKQGYDFICPHTQTQNFQNALPDKRWLEMCLHWLRLCDSIYLLKGWQTSKGSVEEKKVAEELGLELMYE